FLRCCHGEYSGRSSSRAGRVSGGGSALKMRGSGTFFFVLVFLVAFFLVVFFFVVFFFVTFFFFAIVSTLVKKGGRDWPAPKAAAKLRLLNANLKQLRRILARLGLAESQIDDRNAVAFFSRV